VKLYRADLIVATTGASIPASIFWTPSSFFTRKSRTPMMERGSKRSGGRKDLPA